MQDQTTSTVLNREMNEMKRKTLKSIREASRKAFSNPNTRDVRHKQHNVTTSQKQNEFRKRIGNPPEKMT